MVPAAAQTADPDPQIRASADAGDPYALWQLATFYRERNGEGDLALSLRLYEKSFDGYKEREGEAGSNLPIVLQNIVSVQAAMGDQAASLATAERRIALMRAQNPGSADLASAVWDFGRSQQGAGRYEASLASFAEARTLYAALPDDQNAAIGSLFVDDGVSFYNLKQFDKALAAYETAIARYAAAATPPDGDIALTWGNIAGLHFEQLNYQRAAEARLKQVEILRRAPTKTAELGFALLYLAQTYNLSQTYDLSQTRGGLSHSSDALPLLKESREVFAALPGDNSATLADVLMTEGTVRQSLGQYEEALKIFTESASRYEALQGPDSVNLAVTYSNIAQVYNQLTRYADADKALQRSIAIYRKQMPDTDYLAFALQERALVFQGLSKYRDSIPLIAEARKIFVANQGEMTRAVGDTYLNEGISFEGLREYEKSLAAYDEARERYEAAAGKGNILVAYALNNTAWVYRRMGDYARSDATFRQVVPMAEKDLGPTHENTTKVYINVGITSHLLGKEDEAIRWSMRALTNLNRSAETTLDDQRWAYDTLSKAFKGRGDSKRAILFAKLAINAQQKIRSNNKAYTADDMRAFKDEWRFLYQDLADLLIGEGRLAEAQAVLNMEKEDEFSEFIRRDATADLRDSTASLTPREEESRAGVDKLLDKPIAAAAAVTRLVEKRGASGLSTAEEAELKTLETALDDAYTDFIDDVDAFLETVDAEGAGVQKEIEAINLDYTADMQEELRELGGKAAMLQVASLSEATHLFLTVPDASKHYEVKIARADLSRMIFEALDAIERRDPAANDRLKALNDLLVAPISADLKASGAETLMLNLQGFLRYLPFAALYDGQHYLIETYALSMYTPAARTEFETGERAPDKSAGFGVTAAHQGFAPLPGVAREMQAIFGTSQAQGALTGAASLDDKFTRETFQAALKARPAIVHIASHFKLVPGRETDSFLLLGDGSPLSLSDIRKGRGFRFGGVDLLTLSACETARGGGSDGDEVESFGALAQMNGASAVMATLWPVADEATANLMQSFYRHMIAGRMSKADALRAAQIEAIRGEDAAVSSERGAQSLVKTASADTGKPPLSHPYFWSPFVLMGNWL